MLFRTTRFDHPFGFHAFDPFDVWSELRRELGRQRGDHEGTVDDRGTAAPRVDVYDAGASLVLEADVPGLTEKDVELTLDDGVLTISGTRKLAAPEGYSAHRQERASYEFSRSFSLPAKIDPEKTSAVVKNGVLTVTLAKVPEARPRQIPITTSASSAS